MVDSYTVQAIFDEAARPLSPAQKAPFWRSTWQQYQGMAYILLSELFEAGMIASARLLQNGTEASPGMDTVQIIFVRFSITLVLSTSYMWYTEVPEFPLGGRDIRGLLVFRGVAGFVGIFGFYYSVKYLPLAEAIVISFLIPLLTAWTCSIVLHTTFTTRQLLGGLISLLGVVLIARPASIFDIAEAHLEDAPDTSKMPGATTTQRLASIGIGLVADIAGAGVYTVIRVIGDRAHPLISVNYFAIFATLLSLLTILSLPSLNFQPPRTPLEWALLCCVGMFGFLVQYFMTKGLQLDHSNKATNIIYVQILFAVALDWLVWGVLPTVWSWIGGGVVLGATVWVAVQKVDVKYACVPVAGGGEEEGDVELGELVDGREIDRQSTKTESSEEYGK